MKIFQIITFLLILISCDNKQEKIYLKPNDKINKILEKFVNFDKNENFIHEIYIDKQNPHYYEMIIHSGRKSLTDEENKHNKISSLSYAVCSGIEFKIYSGTEYFFSNSSHDNNLKFSQEQLEINKNQHLKEKIWVIKDSFGIITVENRSYLYPYIPLPVYDSELLKVKI